MAACMHVSIHSLDPDERISLLTFVVTAVFLAQAAATVLEDDIDLGGGGVFTAACLGQGFVDRLNTAGFKIETKTITN